jgi:hypothetical protein
VIRDAGTDSGSVDDALGANDANPDDANANDADTGSAVLQKRIDEAAANIQADTCFAQEDTSQCEWASYEVGPAQFKMARSSGEAILVIDDFGAGFFPELVRYRNRILGFYRVDDETIESEVLSVRLPKRLGDALVSFAGPDFIPARSLTALVAPIVASYEKLDLFYPGHGGLVFGHLVELVPEQPLVLMDLAQLFALPPALCRAVDSDAVAAAIAHFVAIAAALKQVIAGNNVRFINASFGTTASTLAEDWSRTCDSAAPSGEQLQQLLHIYDPIYDVLFNTDGVVTAHAGTNLGSPADFPFDQVSAAYPNRVRVGFFSSLSSGLDEAGRGTVSKAAQFPADGDADVYVNWECETLGACADPRYELVGPFGLGRFNLSVMTSSYVNPLALARLVNLRYANHSDQPMSNALVQTLVQEMIPSLCGAGGTEPCVYQDPIVHRQLELYRLHYE